MILSKLYFMPRFPVFFCAGIGLLPAGAGSIAGILIHCNQLFQDKRP